MNSKQKSNDVRLSPASHAIRGNCACELPPAVRELADLLAELACSQLKKQQALQPLEEAAHSEKKGDRA